MTNMDVNATDSSYQYGYPDYPCSPRPLLASVWETNNYDMVVELMRMGPDSGVPFRFEPEAHHRAKPLFFYVSAWLESVCVLCEVTVFRAGRAVSTTGQDAESVCCQ